MLVVAVVPLSWGCKSESNCLFSSLSLFFFFFLLFISSFDVLHELTLHEVTTPPPLPVQARCGFIVALVLKSNVRGFLLLFMRRVDRAPSYIYIYIYICLLLLLLFIYSYFFFFWLGTRKHLPPRLIPLQRECTDTPLCSPLSFVYLSLLSCLHSPLFLFFFFQLLLSIFFFFY